MTQFTAEDFDEYAKQTSEGSYLNVPGAWEQAAEQARELIKIRGDLKTTEGVLRDFDSPSVYQQAQMAVAKIDEQVRELEAARELLISYCRQLPNTTSP